MPMTVPELERAHPSVHGEWLTLLEDLLAGVVHASNNNITALSVLMELRAMQDEALDQPLLAREFARLQAMIAIAGTLSGRSSKTEALELRTVLDMAIGIHAQHRQLRDFECVVHESGVLLPVRVPRSELLRLLLMMIDAAKRARTHGAAVLTLSGDPAQLSFQIASAALPGTEMHAFADACGGVLQQVGGTLRLELPSLLALRRRERAP
jgi:hypothetical protein